MPGRLARTAPQGVKDARQKELQRRYSSARALTLRDMKLHFPEAFQHYYEANLKEVHRKRGPLPGD